MLAVIPARKGTKDKALWKLAGKPLIEWALEACERFHMNPNEIVVTTDSPGVAELAHGRARVSGRPWDLSTSSSLVVDAIRYVQKWECKRKIRGFLVQSTAPFVTYDHFRALYSIDEPLVSAQTIIPVQHNAHWMNQRTMDGFVFKDRGQNSQGKPASYQFGNLIYFTPESLAARNLYLEPSYKVEIPRWYGIDIDDEEDLKLAEAILDKGLVDLS